MYALAKKCHCILFKLRGPTVLPATALALTALASCTPDAKLLPAHPPFQDCIANAPLACRQGRSTCLDLKKHDLTNVVIAHSIEHEKVDRRAQETGILWVIGEASHVGSQVLAHLARYDRRASTNRVGADVYLRPDAPPFERKRSCAATMRPRRSQPTRYSVR